MYASSLSSHSRDASVTLGWINSLHCGHPLLLFEVPCSFRLSNIQVCGPGQSVAEPKQEVLQAGIHLLVNSGLWSSWLDLAMADRKTWRATISLMTVLSPRWNENLVLALFFPLKEARIKFHFLLEFRPPVLECLQRYCVAAERSEEVESVTDDSLSHDFCCDTATSHGLLSHKSRRLHTRSLL